MKKNQNKREVLVMKRRRQDSGNSWIQTYSDMVTLLLAFFVLLYSFSSVDAKEFEEAMASIQHAFMGQTGILEGTPHPGDDKTDIEDIPEITPEIEIMHALDDIQDRIKGFLIDYGIEDDVDVEIEDDQVRVRMPEKILFEKGCSQLHSEAVSILETLSKLFHDELKNCTVIVEGHTCNIPVGAGIPYDTNWDLSAHRAISVVKHLKEDKPERFKAVGHGEHNPIKPNETAEKRRKNRRVELVVSPTFYSDNA